MDELVLVLKPIQQPTQGGMLVVEVRFMALSAGVGLHSCGAHGQVEPDRGVEAPGPLADGQGPAIQHPPPPQHQPAGAALLKVDLQAQLDQPVGAVGGEGRHGAAP